MEGRPVWISLRDVRLPSRRTPEESLSVRFPRLYRALARAVWRLGPQSRLRQWVLARIAARTAAAWTRRDFDVPVTRYDDDAVLYVEQTEGRALLDLEPVYRGRQAARGLMETFGTAWGDIQVEPVWICDLGDGRIVFLQRALARGRGSGVELEDEVGNLLRFEDGVVVEEHVCWGSWDPPLRAAGMDRSRIPT